MKIVLYTGLSAPTRTDKKVLHLPLIQIVPRAPSEIERGFEKAKIATHIILSSKTAVRLGHKYLPRDTLILSVGKSTTVELKINGFCNILTAELECQEGIIELIERLKPENPTFFWPHSSRSRPILNQYFTKMGYPFYECLLYDTHFRTPECEPDFSAIDEIHFSSPSCVDAFFHFFGPPLEHIMLVSKGEVTKAYLRDKLEPS